MDATTWKRHIGEPAFDHLLQHMPDAPNTPTERREHHLATLLTQAQEVGFRAPEVPPEQIGLHGSSVVFPEGQASLTAEGLARYYKAKGHRFYLIRVQEIIETVSGPLMPWWQSILAAYQQHCERKGVPFLPEDLDVDLFVGGTRQTTAGDLRNLVRGLTQK